MPPFTPGGGLPTIDLPATLSQAADIASSDNPIDMTSLLSDERLRELAPELHEDDAQKTVLHSIRDIQLEHETLFLDYVREKQQLEDKYEKLFAPMFSRRREKLSETPIKLFWFKAFEHCQVLRENITDKDAVALQYLTDVSCETVTLNQMERRGALKGLPVGSYMLTFRFADNPFFENDVLTKTYVMTEDDFEDLDEARGTKVLWKAGKDLTIRTMKKKTKNGRVLIKQQPTDSFFNFFSPPQGMVDEEGEVDPSVMEELEDVIDADLELGETIRSEVIPKALLYYLGVAEQEEEEEGEDEDESEDEDEAEDEDEKNVNKAEGKKKRHKQEGCDAPNGQRRDGGDDDNEDDEDDEEDEDEGDGVNFRQRPMLPPPAQTAQECKQQ